MAVIVREVEEINGIRVGDLVQAYKMHAIVTKLTVARYGNHEEERVHGNWIGLNNLPVSNGNTASWNFASSCEVIKKNCDRSKKIA